MSEQFSSDHDRSIHHFVVTAIQTGENTIEFLVDDDTTHARFPDGVCYDGIEDRWTIPHTRNELHNDEVMSRLLKAAVEERTFLRPAL